MLNIFFYPAFYLAFEQCGLKPENKATLTKILTYHVLAGKYTVEDILKAIKKANGKATFTTVSGGKLHASVDMGKVKLTDENGGTAYVTIADVKQKNGIIHVVDGVVTSK